MINKSNKLANQVKLFRLKKPATIIQIIKFKLSRTKIKLND